MNSFSALRECELARTNSKNVSDAIEKEDWDSVLIRYQDVAKNLNELLHCNIRFDDEVRTALEAGLAIVAHNCGVLDKLRLDAPAKLTRGKQFSALRKLDPIMSKVHFNLERLSQ